MTNISVSDINNFLNCRRAWDLTSTNRQSLRHKTTPKMFFVVGSAVHAAIEGQANGEDPLHSFEAYVSREREERKLAYREEVGSTPWQSEMESFDESVDLARSLVGQYFCHYSVENPLEDLGLKYVATEVPFSIPLREGVNFVGTFDGVATDIASESFFYLVENKTAARKPAMHDFWRRNQPIGYTWAFRTLTGHTPAGILYNGILKRVISSPKVLKSGKLSVDKSASVTTKTFLEAINRGGHEPTQYLEYLEFLQERETNGDDRFFHRELHSYSNHELDDWGESLISISHDMTDPALRIYPNRNSCSNCLVRDICEAMDYGEDVDSVVSTRYKLGKYGTMDAVDGATPVQVSSPSELIEYLKGVSNV